MTFENCDFQELVFTRCDLTGCRFQNVAATTLDFTDSTLKNCRWEGPPPRTLGLPPEVSEGITGLGQEASGGGSSDAGQAAANIEAMPALTAFCEMFVARDNVTFDFTATTASGRPVDVHLSKLRYWEFSATGESIAFKTELDDSDDKSPAGIARLLARLVRETAITSVDPKGMKVRMTPLSTRTPTIPAVHFKKLALAAFEELTGAG